jgi:hypothetical protein
MRRSTILALFAAAGLVAAWSFASWAQAIDATPCQKSCYEQKSVCVSACGADGNPLECEARCHDQLTDCLRHCG